MFIPLSLIFDFVITVKIAMKVISLDEENKAKKQEINSKKQKIKALDESLTKMSRECSNLFKTFNSLFDFAENAENAFFETTLGLFEKHLQDTKAYMFEMISKRDRLEEYVQALSERQRMIESALKDTMFIRERTREAREITTGTRNEITLKLEHMTRLMHSIQDSVQVLQNLEAQEVMCRQTIRELQMEQENKREMQRIRYIEMKRRKDETEAKIQQSQQNLKALRLTKEKILVEMRQNLEIQWKEKLESLMKSLDQDRGISDLKSNIIMLRIRLQQFCSS